MEETLKKKGKNANKESYLLFRDINQKLLIKKIIKIYLKSVTRKNEKVTTEW